MLHLGHATQKGMVMITSLAFLLIITLLGVSVMSTTVMEERMAKNSQEQAKNLQVADSGVSSMLANPNIMFSTSYCNPSCADFDDDSVSGDEYGGSGATGIGMKYRASQVWSGNVVDSVEKSYGVSSISNYIDYAAKATNLKTGQSRTVHAGATFRSQAAGRSKN